MDHTIQKPLQALSVTFGDSSPGGRAKAGFFLDYLSETARPLRLIEQKGLSQKRDAPE